MLGLKNGRVLALTYSLALFNHTLIDLLGLPELVLQIEGEGVFAGSDESGETVSRFHFFSLLEHFSSNILGF